MDFAEGGKIDTVLYSAATGALNSTARAGIGAAIGINPDSAMAKPQNPKVSPRLPDRSRLSVSPIGRHISSQKNLAKAIAAVSRCQDRLHDSAPEPEACHELRSLTLPAIHGELCAGRWRYCGPATRNRRLERGAGRANRSYGDAPDRCDQSQ